MKYKSAKNGEQEITNAKRPWSRDGLGVKMVLFVLLTSSIVTVFVTMIQLYFDYQRELSDLDAQMIEIDRAFTLSITDGLWEFNHNQIQVQLQGISRLPAVKYAEVVSITGHKYLEGTGSVEYPFEFQKTLRKNDQDIGSFSVVADLKYVYERLMDKVVVILITQFVKSLIVSTFLLVIFYRVVTRHLTHMANSAQHFDLENVGEPLSLDRNIKGRDELSTVVSAFNTMRENLIRGLRQRDDAEQRLKKTNAGLEVEVERRLHHLNLEIDQRKRVEADLEQARNAAEAANQAKSIFLANMSHELRTPLSAILGFSRILNRDTSLDKDQQERLEIINRSGEHLLGMVDDILSLSKIEAGHVELKRETFDVTQMLQDVGQMITLRAESKGLAFTLELDPALPAYIQGDVGKLRQVLINLLGNAVKFTETGDVWLRARSQPMAEDPDGVMLQLEVQDSGPGMPQDRLDEVFGSFVQLDHAPEAQVGTGLGLTISKTLVDMMGGEIAAKSEPGQGALFTVNVPFKLSEAGAEMVDEDHVAQVSGLASGQPEWRILVVDDNKENRLLLSDLLSRVGFSIREAKDGEEAVRMFPQWQPHFIWMDMRMPDMDGYEATRTIRELPGGAEVKIVAVTASALEEDRAPILAAGCDGLVRKPFLDHEIFDAMARHLEICYIYSERKGDTAADHKKQIELTIEILSELPRELLQELRESTLALDQEATLQVIERIKVQAPETAEGLRTLVESFQMGHLGELLAEVG